MRWLKDTRYILGYGLLFIMWQGRKSRNDWFLYTKFGMEPGGITGEKKYKKGGIMKTFIITIVFVFVTGISMAGVFDGKVWQPTSRKYKNAYKKGYTSQKKASKYSTPTQYTPRPDRPKIGQKSAQDGYNQGVIDAHEDTKRRYRK